MAEENNKGKIAQIADSPVYRSIAGGVLGAGLALMLKPKLGKKVVAAAGSTVFKEKSKDLGKAVKKKAEDIKDSGLEKSQRIVGKVKDTFSKNNEDQESEVEGKVSQDSEDDDRYEKLESENEEIQDRLQRLEDKLQRLIDDNDKDTDNKNKSADEDEDNEVDEVEEESEKKDDDQKEEEEVDEGNDEEEKKENNNSNSKSKTTKKSSTNKSSSKSKKTSTTASGAGKRKSAGSSKAETSVSRDDDTSK
ncbi:YtxH domain-containing protein [Bacillus horti]|uniref:Type I site-specific restriction-modification system R (Restriction) subunit n=1 Tax=Caldalkalibacillus horti TaxID=77523 RepID=A0ABT9VZS6_9BACI|nr:YtxH domain-containing protein [Bacillus horti]MDQ0166494.1 type I site-specific restriction-modification system R (restriction) subunit [Bacillus horti]